jgi:S-disulfanyl-L-cysteine oxidoreductase SoxD
MSRAIVIAALSFAATFAASALGAQPPRSVWDGVYTEEQAKRGAAIYVERCAHCHGPTLGGIDAAAALTGPTFNGNWNGVTLDLMVERVRSTMPVDKPASLSRQQTADVLAYIFRVNKFPAGDTELPRQSEMLSLIQFKAMKSSAF